MLRVAAVLSLALPLTPGPASAQVAAPQPPEAVTRQVLLTAEATLERAIIAKDSTALDTLYATDFEWRHWTGERDTKATWLAFLRDSVTYEEHTARPERVEIYTNAAWVAGTLASKGTYLTTGPFQYPLRYARLWVSDGERWTVRQQVSRPLNTAP